MKEDKRIDVRSKAQWFLDFLYVDIDSLSRAEFLKLLVDFEDIFRGPFIPFWAEGFRDEAAQYPWFPRMPMVDTSILRQELKGYQQHLKKLLKSILDALKSTKLRKTIIRLEMPFSIAISEDRIALFAGKTRDALTAEFVNALKHFSLNDIKKCERRDCGRYFLKATKKEKRYCSNKCAWVMASRKRREARKGKEG